MAAYTWLLLRAKTSVSSVTRAPMVPAVMAGCPVDTPMGTGTVKVFARVRLGGWSHSSSCIRAFPAASPVAPPASRVR